MNFIPRKVFFLLLSAAVIVAGCTRKPRPAPVDTTTTGPVTGYAAVTPTDLGNLTEPSAAGLQPRPANAAGIIEDENTIRGLLVSVYFDFDKSAIKQDERKKIADASDYLTKSAQYRLLLEGHCDWRGTAEYNLGLGDRRAQAVKQFLQNLGPAADKLETLSKGSLGAVENGTEQQMAKDRRVDFVILKK
jgi:peptidoglycan-associated lipoprotein